MEYVKLFIRLDDRYHDALIAELLELDFQGFEQRDEHLVAYIKKISFDNKTRQQVVKLLDGFSSKGNIESEEVFEEQNWNQKWEATIKAREIGQFFIKPTWSETEVPHDKILIEIDPKMAFGTGYHETTRLMLQKLPEIIETGDEVLDAGTGTGILSIAALKLGAATAFGFDIDEWSFSNAHENATLNGVIDRFTIKSGSVETLEAGKKYDVILANINRNVIADLLDVFIEHLKENGKMLLSGLMSNDRSYILNQTGMKNLSLVDESRENNWIVLSLRKK